MGWWGERVVPRLVDVALRGEEVDRLRAVTCRDLSGTVLELGFGGGLNLPHLPAQVDAVHAVEPSDLGWSISAPRRDRSAVPVARVGLDGERLDAADGSYDQVLCTFTLCTVPRPERALAEVRRVLRPGGRFVFLEHGLAPSPGTARWQHRLDGVQRRLVGGCRLTRDVEALVAGAGLGVASLETGYLLGTASPWSWCYRGEARA